MSWALFLFIFLLQNVFFTATLTITKIVFINQSVAQESNKWIIKILEKVGILLYFVSRLSLVAQKRIYAILCVLCMTRLYFNCTLVPATAASSKKVSHDEYLPQTDKKQDSNKYLVQRFFKKIWCLLLDKGCPQCRRNWNSEVHLNLLEQRYVGEMIHSASREKKDTVHTALLLTSSCSSNGVGFEGSQLSCSPSQR